MHRRIPLVRTLTYRLCWWHKTLAYICAFAIYFYSAIFNSFCYFSFPNSWLGKKIYWQKIEHLPRHLARLKSACLISYVRMVCCIHPQSNYHGWRKCRLSKIYLPRLCSLYIRMLYRALRWPFLSLVALQVHETLDWSERWQNKSLSSSFCTWWKNSAGNSPRFVQRRWRKEKRADS